jgi:hypothetical protein
MRRNAAPGGRVRVGFGARAGYRFPSAALMFSLSGAFPDPFDLYGEAVSWDDPPAPVAVPAPGRIVALDALRGWALVYMLISHTAIGLLGWWWWPRGLGWLFFVLVAGALWKPRLGKRYRQIAYAGVASVLPALYLGLALWNILLGWAVVLPVAFFLRRLPVWALALVALQLHWLWPLDGSPGLLMICWLIGNLLGRSGLGDSFSWLPAPSWVLAVSRRPLTLYVGHLWVLSTVAYLLR